MVTMETLVKNVENLVAFQPLVDAVLTVVSTAFYEVIQNVLVVEDSLFSQKLCPRHCDLRMTLFGCIPAEVALKLYKYVHPTLESMSEEAKNRQEKGEIRI